MSATKVKIPLPRRMQYIGACGGWVCDVDVSVLESAYAQACIDRDNALADKRRILDNFAICQQQYLRQDAALEIAMAEIARLSGGKS